MKLPCSKKDDKHEHHDHHKDKNNCCLKDNENTGILKLLVGVAGAISGVYMESRRETTESKKITDIRKWSTAASGWENRAVLTKETFLDNIFSNFI